ncbi:hypothetical protein M1545_03090 [Patescibacteria group bacterium]|nr:hypothetical protein [Patescibacteria group bacterium]
MKGEKEPAAIKELHFGDVYLSQPDSKGKQWKFVIVDVGSAEEDKNYGNKGVVFHAGSLDNEAEGEEAIGLIGTIMVGDVVEIIDRWSVKKVTEALVRPVSEFMSEKEKEDHLEQIRERAKKPHRVLV